MLSWRNFFEDCRYVLLEHATISLAQIVKSPVYPTQRQLAVINWQVSLQDDFHTLAK